MAFCITLGKNQIIKTIIQKKASFVILVFWLVFCILTIFNVFCSERGQWGHRETQEWQTSGREAKSGQSILCITHESSLNHKHTHTADQLQSKTCSSLMLLLFCHFPKYLALSVSNPLAPLWLPNFVSERVTTCLCVSLSGQKRHDATREERMDCYSASPTQTYWRGPEAVKHSCNTFTCAST